MISKAINKYLKKHKKELVKSLRKCEKKKSEDAIHQFRVNTKKVRAVSSLLLEMTSYDLLERRLHKLDAIYTAAGDYRDMQVISSLLNKQQDLSSALEKACNKDLKRHKKSFFHRLKTFRKRKKDIKKLSELQPDLGYLLLFKKKKSVPMILSLVEQKLKQIDQWKIRFSEPEVPHNIRKECKRLLYILSILIQEFEGHKNLHSLYSDLEKLANSFGTWHDHYTLVTWLQSQEALLQKEEGWEEMVNMEKETEHQLLLQCYKEVVGLKSVSPSRWKLGA